MIVQQEDIIQNWGNALRQTSQGLKVIVAQRAEEYKDRGFSVAEARDMLDAQQFEANVVDDVLASVYETRQVQAQSVREAMVCPNSYNEVREFINNALDNMKPKEFVNKLARCADPILRLNDKNLASWYRLAEQAQNDNYARTMLHQDLKPWIEEAIYSSVLASRADTASRVKDCGNDRFVVAAKKFEGANVNITAGTCDCSKFTHSNFGEFGLACEHLIKVAETVSPLQRLKRAIL